MPGSPGGAPQSLCLQQVKKARQALPYSRADVEVWPDEEEVACQRNAAMHAVDACQSSADLDMSAAMQTVETAAVAAAIACSQVCWVRTPTF